MSSSNSSPKHRSYRLARDSTSLDIKSLRKAFGFAVAQQVFLLLFSALLLDGGGVLRRVTVAIVAYWCFAAMFLIRRRNKPTSVDTLFIKYGIWLLVAIVGVVAVLLGRF